MMAGGVGYGNLEQAQKKTPSKGDIIVLLGGDNYRIGMGGAAVSLQIQAHLVMKLNSRCAKIKP